MIQTLLFIPILQTLKLKFPEGLRLYSWSLVHLEYEHR